MSFAEAQANKKPLTGLLYSLRKECILLIETCSLTVFDRLSKLVYIEAEHSPPRVVSHSEVVLIVRFESYFPDLPH